MGEIYFSMFLLGLLSAETTMGFFLLALVWGVYALALRHDAVASNSPILNPIVEQSSKWHLTFLYAFGLVVGVAINCIAYIAFDGLEVFGVTGADMPLIYATHWWSTFIHAASELGWLLGLGICVLPFVVATILLPRAVDEEQFLPYHIGAVYFVVGAVSFAQLAELPPLWFWTWTDAAKINSNFFLLVLMLFSAASVVFALAVMAVEVCCRDHRRLAMERFAELNQEEGDDSNAESIDVKPLGIGTKLMLMVVPLLLLAAVVPGRYQGQTRNMLSIVRDYAKEVLAECGDVKWIFTDGAFDSWLELAAAAEGRSIKALSMMADNSPREQYIRKRGVTNQEDRITLSIGAPMALRAMVRDHADRMLRVTRRGVDAANTLADRILDIYYRGGPSKSAGKLANELFLSVQWRIARIARMRAERADREGKTHQALKDVSISDQLDHNNSSLSRIIHDMDKMRERTLKAITPRESLQLALARADFGLARRYAEPILEDDPDDPNANFGVGMSYYTQKQWARAEEYLRRCLIKKPKEPAVWNNLAIVCLYTERYDEGLNCAKRALELIPDSAEVKDTIKQIEEASAKKPDATKMPDVAKKPEPAKKADEKQPSTTNDVGKDALPAMTSPREEMEKAIANGDFDAAADHAKLILLIDADDPDANFAIGMKHFGKRQWAKAAEKLKRSLAKKPNDPVALNNLAITCLYQQRYDEALKYAEKARDALPGSEDIEDTLNQIKRLKESADKEKAAAKKPAPEKPAKKKPAVQKPAAQKPKKKPSGDGESEALRALRELEGTVPSK